MAALALPFTAWQTQAHFVIHNFGKMLSQEKVEGKRWAGQTLNLRR
jgi:hypothetical protein